MIRLIRLLFFCLTTMTLFLQLATPCFSADGKKWDGKNYPFELLDPSRMNSESNPFIIDTAGKLAYFSWLAKSDLDMEAYGRENGLTGLKHAFQDNFVKMTADLDMNGSRFEFISIPDTAATFDGGGHVITNLRISDKTTKPFLDRDQGEAEIRLALFQSGGVIKNLGIGKGSSITFSSVLKKPLLKVYAAAIAAEAWEVNNCFSDATVTVKGNGESTVGGVAAKAGKVINCYNRGAILFEGNVVDSRLKNRTGKDSPATLLVAGVCADPGTKVSGSYNTGSITVRASGDNLSIGGVAASINGDSGPGREYSNSYNTGSVTLSATGNIRYASVGGVLGYGFTSPRLSGRPIKYIDSGLIYNKGAINVSVKTGSRINVGGIGGGVRSDRPDFNSSTAKFGGVYGFINTYNTGDVSVSSTGKVDALNVGGIAGNGSMVFNSYNTGKISGNSGAGTSLYAGGIGGSQVYIQNSYNIGSINDKGTGTNSVGGLLGRADVRWGEADNKLYVTLNGFWLRQPQAGGINHDVNYAKGSYYYDVSKRAEDSFYGTVYSFNTADASVMTRTDDGPGKRPNLNVTLLDSLNQMVEDNIDRLYRTWKIDGTNGGYPVFSSAATAYRLTAEKTDPAVTDQIAGTYQGVHKQWTDRVIINANGSFRRATGGDSGMWSYDGKRLVLKWKKWAAETLTQTAPGAFSSPKYKFTLTR